jgi:pSer/pThr/pTyr-binding forkhead associated (FHA) protein
MAASLCPQCGLLQSSNESDCAICGAEFSVNDVDTEKVIVKKPTHLLIYHHGKHQADYPLEHRSTVIGRQTQANESERSLDLTQYDSEFVHRRHAEICWVDGIQRLAIRHLGGRNITQVNEQPVPENEWIEIFIGDQVLIGQVSIVVAHRA